MSLSILQLRLHSGMAAMRCTTLAQNSWTTRAPLVPISSILGAPTRLGLLMMRHSLWMWLSPSMLWTVMIVLLCLTPVLLMSASMNTHPLDWLCTPLTPVTWTPSPTLGYATSYWSLDFPLLSTKVTLSSQTAAPSTTTPPTLC